MATSRFFTLLGPSVIRNTQKISQVRPLQFNKICIPSLRFHRCCSSSFAVDSEASTITADDYSAISAHPWPEWVSFVDSLKAKGYFTPNAPVSESGTTISRNGGGVVDEGAVVYTDMKLVKDACLSFARDRFDIFKSLSTQDIQTIVEKGCPNLFRKAVNSGKRLRAYVQLDEGSVCSSCNLRGSCDRAYVILDDSEADARTVDIVRILLFYALDPIVISGENNPHDRELVEASARKLFSQLMELGETPPDPELPKPAAVTSRRKSQPRDSSNSESKNNVEMKRGDWVCTKCNFMNFARNVQCRSCGEDAAGARRGDSEMKNGDWICSVCSFINFARNTQCLKCKAEGPNIVSRDGIEKKKGDWNCPQCSVLNFANKRECFRCREPRPQRQLRPGDWECPDCDFLNFSRNAVCKKCNHRRPQEFAVQSDEQAWTRPY